MTNHSKSRLNFNKIALLPLLLATVALPYNSHAKSENQLCISEFNTAKNICLNSFKGSERAQCMKEATAQKKACLAGNIEAAVDYLESYYILANEPISSLMPIVASESTVFSISPSLPDGLLFDSNTGVISGQTLEAIDSEEIYIVTANSGSTSASDSFVLGVSTTSIANLDIVPEITGDLTLTGVTELGLNSLQPTLTYTSEGFSFNNLLQIASITVNGELLETPLTFAEQSIVFQPLLQDGLNTISFKSYDIDGRPVYKTSEIYAGGNSLTVNLVDELGNFIPQDATINLKLADNLSVSVNIDAQLGTATFVNVPNRTILLEADSLDNKYGVSGGLGTDGSVDIVLREFGLPSEIDNNDISLGLAGWETSSSSSVSVVPHDETQGPDEGDNPDENPIGEVPLLQNGNLKSNFSISSSSDRATLNQERLKLEVKKLDFKSALSTAKAQNAGNQDIRLSTSGEGPQRITRTFTPKPETGKVKVRYRFVTSEIPGGFFGSEFNDYFSVGIYAASGSGSEVDTGSMNGLGQSAFNQATGATQYRTVELEIEPNSNETIRVDATVANVADGLFDSSVEIDFIEEEASIVKPTLTYNSADGGYDLNYEVSGASTTSEDIDIEVFWANGTKEADQTGSAIFTFTVPSGTSTGSYGPQRVFGTFLNDAPDNVSHVIANADSNIGSLADVSISYRPDADANDVPDSLEEILQDGGRQAGDDTIDISSTTRDAQEQADAMFGNLIRGFTGANMVTATIANNVTAQIGVYAAPGDRVIRAYETAVTGLNEAQIIQQSQTIIATMVAQINVEGCVRVSRHCGDPAVRAVIDVPLSGIVNSGEARFRAAVAPQVDRVLDENNVYHLEYDVP